MAFLLVPLSILALGAGPLLFRLSGRSRAATAGLDGFVRVAVGGLLLIHVMPEAWQLGGAASGLAFLIGMLFPLLLHRMMSGEHGRGFAAELLLALAALALHAFLDGAALIEHEQTGSFTTRMLALAVVLHRLPVGVAVWWLVRPRSGRGMAWTVLGALALATLLGSFFSVELLADAPSAALGAFEAFMSGALLHVVVGHTFQLRGGGRGPSERRASGVGGLLGIALTTLFASLHGDSAALPALRSFVALAAESAPALLAASLTIALTKALAPAGLGRYFRGRSRFGQALRGTAAGLPLPICSCGVVPMYQSLIASGTPAAAALAFLIAAPEVGWAAIMLSFGLLGSTMTVLRLGAAVALALGVSLLIAPAADRNRPRDPAERDPEAPRKLSERLRQGFAYGFGAVVDDTGPWILVGIAIAAVMSANLDPALLASVPEGLDVLLATLIGLPLYVCASGSTPLVAVLLLKGLSPGAAVAFLLTGPATNVTTAGLLSRLHGKRVAALFATAMLVLSVTIGFAVNAFFGSPGALDIPTLDPTDPVGGSWGLAALALLALLYLLSLLRLGVPGFLAKVIRPYASAEDPAECGACCSPEAHSHQDE